MGEKEKIFIAQEYYDNEIHAFYTKEAAKNWIRKRMIKDLDKTYDGLNGNFTVSEVLRMIQKDFEHLDQHDYVEEGWYICEADIED